MLKHLNKLICGNRCAVGSGGKSVGYLAHGTATDHMYLKEGVPLAFTWEIYGDMKAHYLDCFKMFNPLTKEHLDSVVSAWVPGFLYLIALLPGHPATESFMEQAGIPMPAKGDRIPSRQLDEKQRMAAPHRLLITPSEQRPADAAQGQGRATTVFSTIGSHVPPAVGGAPQKLSRAEAFPQLSQPSRGKFGPSGGRHQQSAVPAMVASKPRLSSNPSWMVATHGSMQPGSSGWWLPGMVLCVVVALALVLRGGSARRGGRPGRLLPRSLWGGGGGREDDEERNK